MNRLLFIGLFALVLASMVSGQYDYSDNRIDDDDDGGRDARQTPYAAVPPSRSCARVTLGRNNYCGGLSSGTGGGCDSYCIRHGYEYSWCRPTYCLCHRGEDRGRECERL